MSGHSEDNNMTKIAAPRLGLLAVLATTASLASSPAGAVTTIFTSPTLSVNSVAYPGSLGFTATSSNAANAVLRFRLRGTGSVDGDNTYRDDFELLFGTTSLFRGTFNLGGGGNNVIVANSGGATLSNYTYNGFFQGGFIDFSVPISLAAGSNSFTFAYTAPGPANGGGQPLSDEGFTIDNVSLVAGAVPEPATWAMMILGFGVIGGAMRRRRQKVQVAFI
jgi:hypothetical protein